MSNDSTFFKQQGHNESYALVVANGEQCSDELLNNLLNQQPYVVVLDGAIHRFIELNLPFHVLLGDFDRNEIDIKTIQGMFPNVDIQQIINQEKTDLEKAIDYLIQSNFQRVDIIWATGRRADHTITNITNLCRYRGKIETRIIDDYSVIQLLPQKPECFSKEYTKGTPISLIPIGIVNGITTQNLMYSLNNETLTMGYRTGSSNEVLEDGEVTICYKDGDLLLMECND